MDRCQKFKRVLACVCSLFLLLGLQQAEARQRYGEVLCKKPDYHCVTVKKNQSWESLFPDPEQRDILKRVNRMNIALWAGMKIAVPDNLENLTIYDVAPFPRYIETTGERTVFVSQKDLAWGAYDADGELIWWGPISSGKDYCADIGENCDTPPGDYRIIRKQGIDCVSTRFPVETDGGAPMPFCMHFLGGFALHGSSFVPGYRDSHGCVRLFIEDAKWLNEEFISVPGDGRKATRVVVGPPA